MTLLYPVESSRSLNKMVKLRLKERRTNAQRKVVQKTILGEKVANDKHIHNSPTFLAIQ